MKLEFHKSQRLATELEPASLSGDIYSDLLLSQKRLQELSTEEIIACLQLLRLKLSDHRNPLQARYRNSGLAFLLNFLYSDNLESMLKQNLRNRQALDGIVTHEGIRITAVPRGLTGHWLAGNVPILGFISVVQCLLTKNTSLVKLSSKTEDMITPLLEELASLEGCSKLSDAVTVLLFPSDDKAANLEMNSLCKTRVFWGSREAIESLSSMPSSPEVEDCVFGPKVSAAIVAPELLDIEQAKAFAIDITLFNQEACSSPHYFFVKGNKEDAEVAGGKLASALADLHQGALASRITAGEASRVLNFRAEWSIAGGSILTDGSTSWTVAIADSDILELFPATGSRIVAMVPVSSDVRISELLPKNIQTVTCLLPDEELQNIALDLARQGVSRFPAPGHANDYVLPWDGSFVLDRLVNWAVLS